MGLIVCVLVGIFVGWLVAALQQVDEGMLSRMGMGAIGGLLGGVAMVFILENGDAMRDISLPAIAASILGALLLLGIFSSIHGYDIRTGRRQPDFDKLD